MNNFSQGFFREHAENLLRLLMEHFYSRGVY